MKGTNEAIQNLKTGQVIRFVRKQGTNDVLEMEAVYPAGSKEPPVHYHPNQEERFEVLAGELTVRLNGEIKCYPRGSVIEIGKGIPHSMWNGGRERTKVRWQVSPALETEDFLRMMTIAANSRSADKKGLPDPGSMIFLLNRYRRVIRLLKPSYGLTRLLGILFYPFLANKGRKLRQAA